MVRGRKATPGNRKKKSKPARRGGRVGGRMARVPRSGLMSQDVELACSQFDAFCPAARMAKVMDDDSEFSVPYQVRFMVPLRCDGSGSMNVCVGALLKQSYRTAATVVADKITVDGSWVAVPEQTALESSFTSYRFVSWGVRVVNTSAATTCQGLITAKVLSSPPSLEDVGWMGSVIRYAPLNGVDLTFLAKRRGSASKLYTGTATVWASGFQFATDCVSIWITGGQANTTVAQLEILYNLECIPNTNTVAARTATPAALANVRVEQASGNAAALLPGIFQGPYAAVVKRMMGQALIMAGGAAGGAYGGIPNAILSTTGTLMGAGYHPRAIRNSSVMEVN